MAVDDQPEICLSIPRYFAAATNFVGFQHKVSFGDIRQMSQ